MWIERAREEFVKKFNKKDRRGEKDEEDWKQLRRIKETSAEVELKKRKGRGEGGGTKNMGKEKRS